MLRRCRSRRRIAEKIGAKQPEQNLVIERLMADRLPKGLARLADVAIVQMKLPQVSVIMGPITGKGFGQLGARGAGRSVFFEKTLSPRQGPFRWNVP